jgi:hypothetical protein
MKTISLTICLILIAATLHAATPGFDNAADPVYGGNGAGSFDGKDGGTPETFGPWTVTTNPANISDRAFIGDSTTLASGNSGGDINSSGVSFGISAPGSLRAARSFDTPLSIGQTFSIQLAFNARFGLFDKGVDIYDTNGNTIFNLAIAGDLYDVNSSGAVSEFELPYDPNTIFTFQLMRTSTVEWTWTMIRSGGLSGIQSRTVPYLGVPASFDVYASNGSTMYFNNIQVVPEPSTLVLIAGPAFLGAIFYARRRA